MLNNKRVPVSLRMVFLICCALSLTFGVASTTRSAAAQSSVPLATPADNCVPYASNGATHLICMPPTWYGSLIVYAHGYVSPKEPTTSPFPDETPRVQTIALQLGFAFATTSYPTTGLVLSPGASALTDLEQLVGEFKSLRGQPRRTFLVGASEGGLVTTKAIETIPDVFSGGLAVCGPIGDFRKQINYFGDFFVVFNYLFPGFFDPYKADPGGVPAQVIDNWPTLMGDIPSLLAANPGNTRQLIKVTNAAVDPTNIKSVAETVTGLLWYDVFATNDAFDKLGGLAFDNRWRWYSGSDNDWLLNRKVARFSADSTALRNIDRYYQTTGRLSKPLVTMHTTGDPIIPYWHEDLYWWKALLNGSALLHTNIPVARYGHCAFTDTELVTGFALLVIKVTGQELFTK